MKKIDGRKKIDENFVSLLLDNRKSIHAYDTK